MAKPNKLPNFKKIYPEIEDSVLDTLRHSERKMQYQEYDRKAEKTVKDKSGKTFQVSGLEDSIERLEENGVQFLNEAENPEEIIIRREEMEQLYTALSMLSREEQELIHAIYFENQTERQLAEKMGVYRNAIHKKKKRIEGKLKKILKNL